MQKSIRARPVTHKPARYVARNRIRKPPGAPKLRPTITRLTGDVELVAPRGCSASVLLKLVTRDDGHRYYSLWAVVGRYDRDKISVPYKYTGEDTIRFDLPEGMPLSAERLQPYLSDYLASDGTEPPDPPVIKG